MISLFDQAFTGIDLRHWTSGGTALTNFDAHEEPIYLRTIEKYGDPNYVVVREPMIDTPKVSLNFYSLHFLRAQEDVESGPFWKVFREVQEEDKKQTYGKE